MKMEWISMILLEIKEVEETCICIYMYSRCGMVGSLRIYDIRLSIPTPTILNVHLCTFPFGNERLQIVSFNS